MGFLRLSSGADGETFFLMIAPVTDFGFLDVIENGGFVFGEVDDPRMGGFDIVGFDKAELLHL